MFLEDFFLSQIHPKQQIFLLEKKKKINLTHLLVVQRNARLAARQTGLGVKARMTYGRKKLWTETPYVATSRRGDKSQWAFSS